MGREIVTDQDVLRFREQLQATTPSYGTAPGLAAAQPALPPKPVKELTADTYEARLFKLIPSEVVALYIFLDGVLRAAPRNVPAQTIRWLVFALLLCGTWFYLERVANVSKKGQLAASTVAFAVWVFSLGGPFVDYAWYSYVYGAIALPLYTFGVAIGQGKSADEKKKEDGAEKKRRATA
jgi:hypothetical protein